MRIKVNYTRDNRPTSAVVSSEVAKYFGAVHGLPLGSQGDDYFHELKALIQQFVYNQHNIKDRNDIENRMLKIIVQNQSKLQPA